MDGTSLKAWRHVRGWTQAELADALGYKQRQIAYFEHGERPIPPVVELALAELSRRHEPRQ